MKVAFLGATSQIAKDLIKIMASSGAYSLRLFSRRPDDVLSWLSDAVPAAEVASLPYAQFGDGAFDALINCVGSGDPSRTAGMGGSILDVTYQYDCLALDYLERHPGCRYIFLSSGAAYGSGFLAPANQETQAAFPINALSPGDFYSIAKMHAECRHRAISDCAIIDVRIFNYFSVTTDIDARFFISDIVRAIRTGETLQASSAPMRRDFITPVDFAQLIDCVLGAPATNCALDVYSKAPVEKVELLEHMTREFGLKYEMIPQPNLVLATGAKPEYYSRNKRAADFGYAPQRSSLEGITIEMRAILNGLR